MTPALQSQWVDVDNNPYAGGTIKMFSAADTSVFKDSFSDFSLSVVRESIITLDSSGRAIIYGEGAYFVQVFDKDGNLVVTYNHATLPTNP
jgi:hypothetical protein